MTDQERLDIIDRRWRASGEVRSYDYAWLVDRFEELATENTRLRDLEAAIDLRLRGVEGEPYLPYWAGVNAAYADVRKMLRDPDWLTAGLQRPDLPRSPR